MSDSKELINVLSLAPLERYALLNSRTDRRKTFTYYLAMREKIASDFLPLISSREPYINDHSRAHLERVLYNIESILEQNFSRPKSDLGDIPLGRLITRADTVILLNALVWHDIGNIYGREEHGIKVKQCFDAIAPTLYDEHLRQFIIQVAEAHSGAKAIENKIPDSHVFNRYQDEDIHLQFLASVLRIADEIDEDHRRASPHEWEEMNLIKSKNRRFWFFCKSNASVQIISQTERNNLSYWIEIQSHIPKTEFSKTYESGETVVKALTEYFRRILKFERERIYCNSYMKKAYYHPGIAGIKIKLMTHNRNQSPTSGQVYELELSEGKSINSILSNPQYSELTEYINESKTLG